MIANLIIPISLWFLLACPILAACFVARESRIPRSPFFPPRSKAASPAAGNSNVASTHQKDRIEGENCPARAEGSPQYGGCAPGFLFRLHETDCQANQRCALRRAILTKILS